MSIRRIVLCFALVALGCGSSGLTVSGMAAPPQWADGHHDLGLAAQCTGLTLSGDPRTVDLDLTMSIANCTGS